MPSYASVVSPLTPLILNTVCAYRVDGWGEGIWRQSRVTEELDGDRSFVTSMKCLWIFGQKPDSVPKRFLSLETAQRCELIYIEGQICRRRVQNA